MPQVAKQSFALLPPPRMSLVLSARIIIYA